MDLKKGKLNIIASVCFKIITMIMVIFVKQTLIQVCGNEVNGLNALYLSIIGFLSVAELGIGTAITFSMYRPIVEGEKAKVAALYHFFRKAYLIVGVIIFTAGVVLLPFLKYFAKDYTEVNANIYVTFLIMLISVVVTYLFSSKISLINAYKNDYISTTITQSCVILQYILQIIILWLTRSFELYLVCRIIAECVQWFVVEIVTRKKYGDIIQIKAKVDNETLLELKKNIKAMFMHKMGYTLVNTVDGIVISAFVGIIALGEYSNYTTILSSMNGIVMLAFTSLTSVIGHMCVQEEKQTAIRYCEIFHLLNFVIGTVFFLGYYAIIDNLICLLFSPELVVSKSISAVITINGFVQFMRRSILMFRDATGQFYGDRWKPLFEGICNIILSILFVNFFGVTGVIIATIITNLLICHVIEPYVLYKNLFQTSPAKYYMKNYLMIGTFCIAMLFIDEFSVSVENQILELTFNGLFAILISFVICLITILISKSVLYSMIKLLKRG